MEFPVDWEDDVDGPVFRQELGPWLPEAVFDFHSHIFRREDAPYAGREAQDPTMPTVCEAYPVEDYLEAMRRLFPGKRLGALLFNTIDANADLDAQNAYVAESARAHGLHALMVSGLMDDEAALEDRIRAGGFLGLKPYWSYVTWKAQADITLADMLPPGQRRVADRLGLILMTHIPGLNRLADPVNVEGLIQLCHDCPGATVVMAHFGRSYFLDALPPLAELERLARLPNLLVDFSMVQDWEVLEVLIGVFGPARILFGLDMPVAQEKGKLLSANGQRHFFTKRVHPWSVNNSAGSYRMRCTFYAYEIIRAFKQAAERSGLGREDVEAVFWGNAVRVIEGVRAGLA
jgi:predicted TIM-barrel fold metal-dependent hydrolase